VLKALLKSSGGDALPYLSGSLAGDQVTVNVGDGIVNLASVPHCREQVYGKVVVLAGK
jgi:hypothetical protein